MRKIDDVDSRSTDVPDRYAIKKDIHVVSNVASANESNETRAEKASKTEREKKRLYLVFLKTKLPNVLLTGLEVSSVAIQR